MIRSFRLLVLLAHVLIVPIVLAGTEPPGTKPPAADRIPALIAQLGSNHFTEREAASRELGKIGLPARAALKVAAKSKDAEVRRRARRLLDNIGNSLAALIEDYRRYGLPLPAKAPLVSLTGDAPAAPGKPPVYCLAFLLEPGSEKRPPRLLQGKLLHNPSFVNLKTTPFLDPARTSRKQLEEIARHCDFWPAEDGVLLALQCHSRGWDVFARALFAQALRKEAERARMWLNASRSPQVLLHTGAWDYWKDELIEGGTPWARIHPHLTTILADARELDTEENRALLKSLELALVPSKAKPGSIEALIDDLMNMRSTMLVGFDGMPNTPYARLAERGFDVVPALIDHLDDNRLTRYIESSIWMGPGLPSQRHYRVGDAAFDLLLGLSGEADWQQPLSKTTARAWWTKARKIGEEPYLAAHALPEDEPLPSFQILRILVRKYPRSLARVYRTLLDRRPKMASWPVVDAIAGSSLPRRQKIDLFLYAAKKDLEHSYHAFHQLATLEPERFRRLLLETLDHLPATPRGKYALCPESLFVHFVVGTEDKPLWQALERAARRADPQLRLEYLKGVGDYGLVQNGKQQLAFLAAFLDDATARDAVSNPESSKKFYAGHAFPKLEVRNFAALKLAELLKVKAEPKPTWTPAQWAELRQQVRRALRERKGR